MTERSPSQNQCLTEKFSEVLIQRLNYVLLSLILLAQSVYVQGSNEANLTTSKAVSVPGGYVVPVHYDIVFRCHAPGVHENNFLSWNIDLGPLSLNGTATIELGKYSNHKLTVDEKYKKNPAEVHIHNLQLNESGSKIQCLGFAGTEEVVISSIVHIYVEDSPKCPGNLTITETPLGFNLTWSGHSGLLPVTYNISVVSHRSEVVMSTSNSHIILDLEDTAYHWQSNTTYCVSVTACTSAGCSQDCGNTTMRTGVLEDVNDSDPTKVDDSSPSLSDMIIPIVVVPAVVALFIIILIVIVLLSWCFVWKRQAKKQQGRAHDENLTIGNSCNRKSPNMILCQNDTLEDYATVSDAKGKSNVPPSHLSVQSTTSQNDIVVDMEGYGVVQNAAKTPQKVRSMESQRHRVMSDIPEPQHYAEVNDCCAQTKPPLLRSQSNPHHQTVAVLTTSLPPEYAEVPDTIRTRLPVQRSCSIPTASSIEKGPPIPPRGYIQSPENSEVIDAGYASLPHQNTPSRVTKVCSSRQGGKGSPHFNPEGTVA